MQIKRLLLGLFLLFPIVLIFNQPGVPNLEFFYKDTTNFLSFAESLIKYPPGLSLIYNIILKTSPPDSNIYFFYNQTAWIIFKFLLFLVYYLTFFSIVHLSKSLFIKHRLKKIDLALAYFGSVSIMLVSVGLSFPDILAVPFFILSTSFLFKKRVIISSILFLVALSFNGSLLILGPPLFLYTHLTKMKNKTTKFITFLSYVVLPTTLFISYLTYLDSHFKNIKISNNVFGYSWLLNRPFKYILSNNYKLLQVDLGVIVMVIISLLSIVGLVYLIKKLSIFRLFIVTTMVFIFIFKLNMIFSFLISLFVTSYLKLLSNFKSKKVFSKLDIIYILFSIYTVFLLFFPSIQDGNLLWIVILSLIAFVLNKSKYNNILLLSTNILIFINLFVVYGSAGNTPVNGEYFFIFQSVFSILFTLFSIIYIVNTKKVNQAKWLKKFLIVLLIALNLSLFTATGTGDNVSFNDTAVGAVKYINPFKAHAIDPEMYPPLSTVIIGIFANGSKLIFGETPDYKLAVKASIIIFYFLTIFVFYKFSNKFQSKQTNMFNKLLIMLTTFSLIIQTQGLSDINIYVLPTLTASMYLLFDKKYLFSGLLFGLTFSIKPQPVFVLPLFGATIIDLRNKFSQSLKRSLKFTIGLLIVPTFVWLLVIINPGGIESLKRFANYIFNTSGFHLLSGQALNLNWVVTYFLHIFQPTKHFSLEYLGWYNWQVPSNDSPLIFQGLFFYISAFIIYLIYWLKLNKNIFNFLSTSVMIFFSHQMLNKSAHEKHLFYVTTTMLLLFLIRSSSKNRVLLILFDVMTVINLILFYGFTGPKDFNRLFFGFDLTVLFAAYYFIIYIAILRNYILSKGKLLSN